MVTIKITTDEMMESMRLKETSKEEASLWEHLQNYGFLFNEFKLVIYGKLNGLGEYLDVKYKVKIDGYGEKQKIYIKEIIIHENAPTTRNEYEITVDEFLSSLLKMIQENISVKSIFNWNVNETGSILVPMFFMKYCIDKAMQNKPIEVPVTKKKYKPMNERSKSKPKTEYKLFEIIRKYEKHMNKNKHHIMCEHWEVKGHFRHYKNGKVVYIKPFSKGKNKDSKTENRIYRL